MSNYAGFIFRHLPLEVEFITVCSYERELHIAVTLTLSLRGPAVSCVASNVAAFRGTCKILKREFNLLFVLNVVAAPHFMHLNLFL
jgi:hypothetical protein